MGREIIATDSKWTKGLRLLLRLLAPDRGDLFDDRCRKAVVDAEGTRLLYMTLLDHARNSDDDTQPYDPDAVCLTERVVETIPNNPKTARKQWELKFAKTIPLPGVSNPVI